MTAPRPRRPDARSRALTIAWLALWLVGVASLTLTPGGGGESLGTFCFPCGARGSADAVLNVGLFMPGGALLGLLGAGVGAVAAAGFGLSLAIELIQTQLPGRFPTVADVAMNGGGAVLGLLFLRFVRAGRFNTRAAAVGAAVALTVTAGLGRPAAPAGPLFGQHTPRLGGWAPYEGEVVRAAVGEVEVPSGRHADPDALRAALIRPAPLVVEFVAGPRAPRWAPIFAVFSEAQVEGVFVAARGDDLFVRLQSWAGRLHFAEPSLLLEGALAGVATGERVTVRVERGRTGYCVAADTVERCGLDASPVEGWRLLYPDLRAPGPWPVFTGFYVALVVALLIAVGSPRAAAGATAGLLVYAALLALATSSAPPEPVGVGGGLAAGVVVGTVVRALARRLGRRRRATDTVAGPAHPV